MNTRVFLLDSDPRFSTVIWGRRISLPLLFLAALLFSISPAVAQPLVEEEQDIQVLSPFTVVADEDQGYMATQTLSGSRMNVPLFITSAPVNVFTKQFLDDLGATDVAEAYLYNLSVQPTRQGEQSHNFRSEIFSDTVMTIRGLSAVTARNYFSWNALSDNYNVERLDFSRGPNNILFGTAGFGGVVNVSTKQAILTENLYNVTLRYGDWNLYRGAVDANVVLIPDELGIRLNALWHEEKDWQNHARLQRKAAHASFAWIPFQGAGHRTTIRGEFETLNVDQLLARRFPFMERWSAWDGEGVVADNNPTGVEGVIRQTGQHIVFNESDETFFPLMGRYMTNSANHPTGAPPEMFPREFNVYGNFAYNDHTLDNWTVWVEQQLFHDLFVELAYNRQFKRHEFIDNVMHDLWVDANLFMEDDVTPNPRFGDHFVRIDNLRLRPAVRDYSWEARLTASYTLDTDTWLGQHAFAAMASRVENKSLGSWATLWDVDHHLAGDNAARQTRFQRYVTTDDGLHNTAWDPHRMIGLAAQQGMRWGFVEHSPQWQGSQLDTYQLTWVGRFLEDQFVTTGGIRRNILSSRNFEGFTEREVGDPLFPVIMEPTGSWTPWETDARETTYTYGATVAPTPGSPFRFYYNFAEVFVHQGGSPIVVPPGLDYNPPRVLHDPNLPARVADSEDYGVRFRLFEGRLAGSLGYYETIDSGAMGSIHGWSIHAMAFVMDLMDGEYTATRGTTDRTSTGFEFEMTANPTDNFRLMFNLSRSKVTTSNNFPEFFEIYRPGTAEGVLGEWMTWVSGWRQGPDEVLPDGIQDNTAPAVNVPHLNRPLTFEEAHGLGIDPMYEFGDRADAPDVTGNVLGLQNWISRVNHSLDLVNLSGMSVLRHREFRANIYGVYAFPAESMLRGFSIGGGMKFFDRPIIAQDFDPLGDIQFTYGNTRVDTDAMIAYRHDFDNVSMRLQLNIDNILNRNVVEFVQVPGHSPTRPHYQYNDPRRLRLTASFDF